LIFVILITNKLYLLF